MKNLIKYLLLLITISVFLFSCKKKEVEDIKKTPQKFTVNGCAQKGPFINGSTITISELDSDLSPTGRTFSTTIVDDKGSFTMPNIELSSNYVQLTANGFYFDEVGGELSTASIILQALADLSEVGSENVNVITHLEKSRVEYLTSHEITFHDAKKQAQKEILSMFNIQNDSLGNSENMNIANGEEKDAILLAISAILQGSHSPAEMTQLLSNISTDLREDGILTSTKLQSELINEATIMNKADVRKNITQRYNTLGVSAKIGDFETYINNFINTSEYVLTKFITYPTSGKYGINILDSNVKITTNGTYSMTADLPMNASLKVVTRSSNIFMFSFMASKNYGWEISNFDAINNQQIYTSTLNKQTIDMMVYLSQGSAIIEIYENNAATPTRIKTISW